MAASRTRRSTSGGTPGKAGEYIWRPAIVVMERPGTLELDFSNEDDVHHLAGDTRGSRITAFARP